MLQVCLNGARTRNECAALPGTPDELAAAAREAVRAGAEDIHLHPKDATGQDTLDPDRVAAAVAAVRAAVPGVPVGVTTGAWTATHPGERVANVGAWTVLPDHASVNWHEDGAAAVAEALLARGIGVEAGIYSGTDAARRFLAWPHAHRALRVLAEVTDTDPLTARETAAALLDSLKAKIDLPILLHGQDTAAWTILTMAAARCLDTRIGLEDVLHLPDESPAESNDNLILAARHIIDQTFGQSH
ncbi:3-keto-5-aminohexanoate cleavage protein [Nocardia brasiliensis]|uniref:3-keto-5-aminohexanoate cleavage protein n=1 Tax=Nocardia brasiliensis TaxID=37326 RepID=UPI001894330C|nr:3-keto-5-aminohexanoate cleavage protein [Nocardia brasiliensis]MBF6544242.1 3-keto-5-aminohexanoate cleavage protein [Nocardia brasiliensis]